MIQRGTMAAGTYGWKLLAGLAAGVVAIQAGTYAVLFATIGDAAARGQFGDAFGFANALFSGLGFAGLICTLNLQRAQITAQQDEAAIIHREAAAALTNQQRSNHLSALTFLMAHYDVELARLSGALPSGPSGATLLARRATLKAHREQLEGIIGGLHAQVVSGLGDRHVR
ncbi:hypothetical protein LPN01_10175 [Sphingomonas sp. A2-49]|uniref:hypothetical protein n=1 Tax=Sphingomonas sp. A2-49 TaxID=1391375 RepID=UPI0021CE92DC|nr:hypothetical protein [Sphingomonas sp. A2-49]MCU6454442.1 hypothetical protein [Sphingomonas sp. A2-49]